MNQEEKFNKVVKLMEASELDTNSQEQLRVFLFSLLEDPQFEKIIDMLEKFPSIMDHFSRCFELKYQFFERGGTPEAWDYVLEREEELVRKVDDKAQQGLL